MEGSEPEVVAVQAVALALELKETSVLVAQLAVEAELAATVVPTATEAEMSALVPQSAVELELAAAAVLTATEAETEEARGQAEVTWALDSQLALASDYSA